MIQPLTSLQPLTNGLARLDQLKLTGNNGGEGDRLSI